MRALPATALAAAALLALIQPVRISAATAPSGPEVYDAAWTYLLSAATHASDASTDPSNFCRVSIASLARYFPEEKTREELRRLAISPVVSAKFDFLPTIDDCVILLWYVRAVHRANGEGVVDEAAEAAGLTPSSPALALDPDEEAVEAALGLWESPARDVILAALDKRWRGEPGEHVPYQTSRPQLRLFIMSACPYGVQAEDALLGTVLPLFGDLVDARLDYIAISRFREGPNGTVVPIPDAYCASAGTLSPGSDEVGPDAEVICSMHGAGEANEDARQMAVRELYGESQLQAYVVAFNERACDAFEYDNCTAPVLEALGLDTEAVIQRAAERLTDYALEIQRIYDEVAVPALRGGSVSSPTLLINGRHAATGLLSPMAYVHRICSFFTLKDRPALCDAKSIEGMETMSHGAPPALAGGACLVPETLPAAIPTPEHPYAGAHLPGKTTQHPLAAATTATSAILVVAAGFAIAAAGFAASRALSSPSPESWASTRAFGNADPSCRTATPLV